MPRRYLVAPDKFKGSLSAPAAAAAIVEGIRRVDPSALIDICPIADGGEGFMETLATAMNGTWVHCPAVDPLGRAIDSRYVLAETPAGLSAILEIAETAGMWRLNQEERDPLHTTTRGVGRQIAHAIREHAVSRIILGLGGSATNDGGAGMAEAMGVHFLGENEVEIDPTPGNLTLVRRIDSRGRIELPLIIAACDVDNPLLGPRGSSAVFSAQKGSTPETRPILERALAHLVRVAGAGLAAEIPGAGAAGGLGFGLLHFAGARLTPGFDLLAGLTDLESRVKAADHVITGEGSIDHQSLSGKGPVGLAKMAIRHSIPVTAFCGSADQAARDSGIFPSLHALADSGLPLETLIGQAGALLTERVANTRLV